jgi:muramoyltetrapeptide carboxypeptidase LdcA involved in peptidoglycan recycling
MHDHKKEGEWQRMAERVAERVAEMSAAFQQHDVEFVWSHLCVTGGCCSLQY